MRIFIFFALLFVCLSAASAQESQAPKAEPSASSATIGIVVDCSGSQRLQLDKTIAIVKQIADAMRQIDEAFVVRFVDSQKISVVQDFTPRKEDVQDAADELFIEGGQTAIVDAINFAARHFSGSRSGARVLILITDGDDRKNEATTDESITLMKRENVRLFAIGISDLKVSARLLDKLSKETGGKAFVPRTTAEVSNAVLDIMAAIRNETITKK